MASRVTNIALSETGITFKRVNGHSHDGVNSTLIDTTKYSLFDFTPALPSSSGDPRQLYRDNNLLLIKKFIVDTIEERVLNPQGIAIKANTITAREIVSGTITSDQLSANLILVNNIIQSNNYTAGSTGWYISYDGSAEFSNVIIRGTVVSNSGNIGGWTIDSNSIYSGTKGTNGAYTGVGNITISTTFISSNQFTIAANGVTTFKGTLSSPTGNIGGWTIGSSRFYANTSGSIGFDTYNANIALDASTGTISSHYDRTVFMGSPYYVDVQINNNSDTGISVTGNASLSDKTTRILSSAIIAGQNVGGGGGTTITGSFISMDGSVTINTSNIVVQSTTLIGANITVGNNLMFRATTQMRTSGSSTTARVSTGDISGFDILARPTSLRELKENIEDIPDALSILNDLRPRSYNFKVDAFSPVDPHTEQPWTDEARELARLDVKYGFIVDEVVEKRPELVSYYHENTEVDPYEPGGYFDFDSWKPTMWEDIDVLVLSVKGIQELNSKIQNLKSKIEELESRLKAVEDV